MTKSLNHFSLFYTRSKMKNNVKCFKRNKILNINLYGQIFHITNFTTGSVILLNQICRIVTLFMTQDICHSSIKYIPYDNKITYRRFTGKKCVKLQTKLPDHTSCNINQHCKLVRHRETVKFCVNGGPPDIPLNSR